MKFSLKDATEFGWDGVDGKSYSSKEDFVNASAAYFEVTDKGHGKIKTPVSDRIYYVIEGEGSFVIKNKEVPVLATDVVIVPKDTPYDYRAKPGTVLKLFLVHTPAFEADLEKRLD